MAVEIPVVVDINAAFKEAAAQVPSAIRPLQQSIDKYTADLMSWTEKMRNAKIDSPEFIKAAKNIQAISQALEVAEDRLLKFSSNPGSIRRMSGELAALERRWQEMGSKQKFDASGNLSADAQKLYESYKKMAAAIAESGKSLSQMYSEEQKIAEEQRKAAAAAQAHQDALRATASSIKGLSASSAAWRQELNNIDIYKNPALFLQAAQNAEYLSRQMAAVSAQVKMLGANTGSIDQLNAHLQEIVRQYNALSESDRRGVVGKQLINDAKALSAELKKEESSVQRIIQEEQRLDNLKKQSLQTRRKENAILKMNGDSIRILSEQQRILTERLAKARIGSSQFEQLKTQLDGVSQKLQQVQGGVQKATGSINTMTTAMRGQSSVLQSLTSMASMYVSVFGALRFAKQIRDVAGELEFQRIALGRLIQDMDYGNKLFDRIKAAAVESPFRIGDLVTYTKQLAAYRIEQENLFDTTRRLADISAGLGVDMNRLILAYGQVRAASVLRGQELRQFTEAGIPLVELLAEKFSELRDESVSTADVFKLISERAVPFSMIADIFEDLTDKGGMFYEMQKRQAETLKGRWEKLKDTFDIALQSIGETKTFERYNNIVLDSLTFLSKHLTVIPKLIEGASAAWLIYYAATTKSRIATKRAAMAEIAEATAKEAQSIANIKGIKNVNAYTAAMIRQRVAANGLERGFWKLWAAIVANPLGAALAAIGAITTALVFWNKKNKDVEQSSIDLNNTIEKLSDSVKDYQKVEKLAKRYETLASKTERSAKENLKLSQTIDALNERFPDLTLKMDDDTAAIENNTAAIKKNNEERREDARREAEKDLKLAEQTLEQQVKQRDELRKSYEAARDRAASAENLSGSNWQVTYDRYVKEANEAKALWEKAADAYNVTLNQVTRLRERLEPTETTSKAWKEQLRDMQLAKNGAQLFSNEAIDGWSRLYDASNDLEKEWKRLKEELDGMRESASKVKPEFMSEWTKDVESLESKLEGLELIRLFFGFAWGKQSTSRGSDTRLSDLKKQISEITNAYKKFLELRKYMSDEAAQSQMSLLFPQFAGERMDMENTLRRLEDMREDVAKKLAKSPKDKTLLEMQRTLDTEISNLKFDDLKKKIDDELKRISSDIKRSETARNFYNDILGLTGDNELAASLTMSVYGTEGEEFADRIKKQLVDSLSKVDEHTFDGLSHAIVNAFNTGDYKYLMDHLEEVPEKLRDTVKQVASDSEKYNADWLKNFYQTYQKAKTYEERISTLQSQRDTKVAEAQNRGMSQEDIDAITAYYAKKIAGVELEALKDTYTWTKAFEDLEGVSTQTLNNLIALIDEYIQKNRKNLTPAQLRELTRSRENVRAQVMSRNAYLESWEALKKMNKASQLKKTLDIAGLKGTEAYTVALNDEARATLDLQKSLERIKGYFDEAASAAKDLVSVFASDEYAAYFSEQMDNASKTLGGLGKAATGIASIAMGNITPKTIMQTVTGLAEAIAGIFGARNAARMRKANQDIEEQDRLLEDLEYQYGRLQVAMEKSFGSDYIANYNQQLDNLAAKQAAYLKQAEAERSKGKKADEEKIKGYENSARDAADQIRDMQTQLAEFFSGTDLTSAAKDFANAWIEAYKEFGSVTDAMSEKFNDMIQEMVENSVAAQVMQQLLKPIFDEIDRRAREGGELSTEDIAAISKMATEQIPAINDAMTTLMNSLQAAGYDFRQQPGQFTGISRNIANATEESITGLAAGINTQNFYMSMINQNVAAILAVISGGAVPTEGAPSVQFNNELALQRLSGIDDKLATLLNQLDKVIKPMSVPAQYYVSVRQ